jgi:hypothetical protein
MLFLLSEIRKYLSSHQPITNRHSNHITPIETTLYIWFAAFAYEELGQFIDAGSKFYAVDIWSGCDLIIILIGMTFIITSRHF